MTRSSWRCAVRRFRGLYASGPKAAAGFANDNREHNRTAREGCCVSPGPSRAGARRLPMPKAPRREHPLPDAAFPRGAGASQAAPARRYFSDPHRGGASRAFQQRKGGVSGRLFRNLFFDVLALLFCAAFVGTLYLLVYATLGA